MKRRDFLTGSAASVLLAAEAAAQFNGCGRGICPSTFGLGAAGSPAVQPVLNVATRGQVHTQTTTNNGTKTRFKGRLYYRTGCNPISEIQLPFSNWYLVATNSSATETNGANDVTITKLAIEYNGVTVPVTYQGSRSFTVAAGTAVQLTDAVSASAFGVSSIPANADVYVRVLLDITAGQSFPSYPMFTEDKGYRYDPSGGNTSDDVDSTGVMAVPTSADGSNQPPFAPIGLFGRYTRATKSLLFLGDSIVTSSNDANTQGNAGGCWIRRAAWAAGIGYFGFTIGSYAAGYWSLANTKRKALLGYFTDALNELGLNDIGPGGTPITANRGIWTDLRAGGIQRIYQTSTTPKTTSTTKFSDVANQTPVGGFTSGAERDTTNASYLADVGVSGRIDGVLDVAAVVQDGSVPTKWAARAFNTTLAAGYTGGTTSMSLTAAPSVGEYLTVSSSGTFDAATPRKATVVSGSGPYTVTLNAAFTSNHSSSDPVYAVPTPDGTHPSDATQAAIATAPAVSSYFSGLAA